LEYNNIADGILGLGIIIYSLVQYVTNKNLGERVTRLEATLKTYMELKKGE